MSKLMISGLDELTSDLEKAIGKYPDMAENSLKKMGNRLKKEVVKTTKAEVKQNTGKLVKGYKVSKVTGYGTNMQVDFSGTAPHFHLVENGHRIVGPGGKEMGFVPGRHMVKKTAEVFPEIMEVEMRKMIDTILKDSDLI